MPHLRGHQKSSPTSGKQQSVHSISLPEALWRPCSGPGQTPRGSGHAGKQVLGGGKAPMPEPR
eukprot:9473014-Lingulodinium_polyedra.AAC.1